MSPGHDVWTYVPEEGDAQLRGYYALESNWGALEAQVLRGTDAQIVIVDPELNEREESRTPGPGAVATLGAAYGTADADSNGELDGLPLYIYQNDDPAGTWRGIFMANDNGGVHSPKWRTHEPVRMLTANAGERDGWAVYIYRFGNTGHAAAGITGREGDDEGAMVFGWQPGETQAGFFEGGGASFPFYFGSLQAHWLPSGIDPIASKADEVSTPLDRVHELTSSVSNNEAVLDRVADCVIEPYELYAWWNDGGGSNQVSISFDDSETMLRYAFFFPVNPWIPKYVRNCSQFAGIVSGVEPTGLVSSTPGGLSSWVDARHSVPLRPFNYLKGRLWANGEIVDCPCASCQQARQRW